MAGTGTRTRPPARKSTGRTTRPAAKRGRTAGRSPAAAPFVGAAKAIAAIWRSLASVLGTLARAAGRNAATARELDPAHRRDGAALGVLAFGLICVMAVWFSAAGPVGHVLDSAFRAVLGNGAVLLPIALLVGGAHMLRQAPEPHARGRVVVGGAALAMSVLGLFDVWAASPTTSAGRAHAGGLVGTAIGSPLSHGLSAVIAVPLLAVVGIFGILVLTATPISVLVDYLRTLTGFGRSGVSTIPEVDPEVDETVRKPRRRRTPPPVDDGAESVTEQLTPAADDATAAIPAVKPRKPRTKPVEPELPPIDRPIQLELSGGGGLYTLPSIKDLAQGSPHLEHPKANAEVIARYFGAGTSVTASGSLPAGRVLVTMGVATLQVPVALGGPRPAPAATAPSPAATSSSGGTPGGAVTVKPNAQYGVPCVY